MHKAEINTTSEESIQNIAIATVTAGAIYGASAYLKKVSGPDTRHRNIF